MSDLRTGSGKTRDDDERGRGNKNEVEFHDVNWRAAGYAAMALAYWVVVLSLPSSSDGLAGGWRIAIAIVGCLLAGFGLTRLVLANGSKGKHVAVPLFIVALGIGAIVVALLAGDGITLGARRFGLGVGGVALAALLIGLQQFRTVRAAGSVALLVLFIGVATWPATGDVMPPDVRERVLTWTGVILGVSVVAEAGKQAAVTMASSRTAAAAIAVAGAGPGGGPPGGPGGDDAGGRSQGGAGDGSVTTRTARTPAVDIREAREPAMNDSRTVLDAVEAFRGYDPPGDLR